MAGPDLGGLLRGDAIALGLVEEMNDAVACVLDGGPVIARKVRGAVDHRTEWCTALELWGCPGIPVADRVHGAFEVDFVNLFGTVVGVGIVPEQASFSCHFW